MKTFILNNLISSEYGNINEDLIPISNKEFNFSLIMVIVGFILFSVFVKII